MTEVIGIDHIYITASDLQRSESFYDRVLLEALGFQKNNFILGSDPHVQYFNQHFGYVIRPSHNSNRQDSYAPGLHHFCLRVASIADVVAVANQLRAAGVEASEGKLYPEYARDYWVSIWPYVIDDMFRQPTVTRKPCRKSCESYYHLRATE